MATKRITDIGPPHYDKFLPPVIKANYGKWAYHDVVKPGVMVHVAEGGDKIFSVRCASPRILAIASIREFADLADCALRFCDAALKADRLTMLSELENASTRDELKSLLFDATMCLKLRLSNDIGLAERIGAVTDAIFKSYPDIERNINIKLLCTHLVAQL